MLLLTHQIHAYVFALNWREGEWNLLNRVAIKIIHSSKFVFIIFALFFSNFFLFILILFLPDGYGDTLGQYIIQKVRS